MNYLRPQHALIADLLQSMNGDFLEKTQCFFGGGTAIVMAQGEYRLSLDVDFLCADTAGYRDLRNAVRKEGAKVLFGAGTQALRDFRIDQYGIRSILEHGGQPVKFEIVRESRITLSGSRSTLWRVPVLDIDSQFAEKLLANSDRCYDRAVAYRDVIDLGFLVRAEGFIPPAAIYLAEAAYSPDDIVDALAGAIERLSHHKEVQFAAGTLQMNIEDVLSAVELLRAAAHRAWPKHAFFAKPQDSGRSPDIDW